MIDFYASEAHYASHLRPVHDALPVEQRGAFLSPVGRSYGGVVGLPDMRVGSAKKERAVVASYGDFKRVLALGYQQVALMQHGAGQSYAGTHDDTTSAYPGGKHQDRVSLFLCPNEYSADRWRKRYAAARIEVIGSPRVEHLPAREGAADATVAVSFHWLCNLWPETRPAFGTFKPVIADLKRFGTVGHGHPRAMRWLAPWYKAWGIEIVPSFDEVCKRADVYVCDNSSTIFEFAATGRPVVLMNSPDYRRHVNHGGRFWDWASVGLQVDRPADLVDTVRLALLDPKGIREERERIVRQVYAQVAGSTEAAVKALLTWA